MRIHLLSLAALCVTCTCITAQTKKIAFESHSGSPENFSITLNNELFDSEESDFGLPTSKSKYRLDSIIYISDSSSLLVSKEYKAPWEAKSDSQFKYIGVRKDTVYNNPLFSRKNSADSIRKGLKSLSGMVSEYEASNKTIFVGFEKNKSKQKEKEKEKVQEQQVVPVFSPGDPPDNNSPFDPKLVWMLGSILLLSVAGGLVSWKLYKPQPATV